MYMTKLSCMYRKRIKGRKEKQKKKDKPQETKVR